MRYVHVHVCLQYNVHIKTVPSLLVTSKVAEAFSMTVFVSFYILWVFLGFFIQV